MNDLAAKIMAEIEDHCALHPDDEAYVSGLKRALVLAVGREQAERVFAAYGEAY